MEIPKDLSTKVFKGCGCISIGIVVLLIAFVAWALTLPDEEVSDEQSEAQTSEQTQQNDSITITAPMEGDPYKELDELTKSDIRAAFNSCK